MKVLELQNISKSVGEKHVLRDLSLEIEQGEFVTFLGPSGCGKTTMLKIIAGLENRSSGKIYIDGKETEGVSSKIGYMLQKDNLLEWRTIYKNVIFWTFDRNKYQKCNWWKRTAENGIAQKLTIRTANTVNKLV